MGKSRGAERPGADRLSYPFNSSAMYNTGADALPSVAWVVGFIFWSPSLMG